MTAWLVRIIPDSRNRAVRRELNEAVRLHERIMMLAPDGLGDHARHQAGVLYRVDESRTGTQILVQTRVKPETSRFPDTYGQLDVRDLSPLLGALRPGQAVHYRLAANTTKRLGRTAGDKAGKLVALHGVAAEQWWATRAPSCGLSLKTLTAHAEPGARGTHRSGHRIQHAITRFDGIAVVTNPEQLQTAVLAGIGRGKSHGCGLLTVAPLRAEP